MTATSRGSGRRRPFAGTLLGVTLVAAACSGSGSQRVDNDQFGMSFTIDEDWALYDEQAYFAAAAEPPEGEDRAATTWVRAFDASDEPSLANVVRDDAPAPRGIARIEVLSERERESVNLASLRSSHLGFDPVAVQREQPDGPVEVLRQEELSLEGGQHGLRMVVAYETPAGPVAVVDQTVLLDGNTSVRHLFVVGCSEGCYLDNQDTIEEVVASLTFEKRR